jgi:hypothetical protein
VNVARTGKLMITLAASAVFALMAARAATLGGWWLLLAAALSVVALCEATVAVLVAYLRRLQACVSH